MQAEFVAAVRAVVGARGSVALGLDGVSVVLAASEWPEVALALRDAPGCALGQLVDVCGVDFAAYGGREWAVDVADVGFGRGVESSRTPLLFKEGCRDSGGVVGASKTDPLPPLRGDSPFTGGESSGVEGRFAVVYHLLSHSWNARVRVRVDCEVREGLPLVGSVVGVWPCANWYEREAFDLFGIVFEGHPDLRRILTDYGFVGHPLRKDFPLSGHVEVRYDAQARRVVYVPVAVEPRVLVPRVVR